ncbi:hypothetical protein Tco_0223026 [Tanacetum coccineum]
MRLRTYTKSLGRKAYSAWRRQLNLHETTSGLQGDVVREINTASEPSAGGKLRDRNAKESWALLEDLALYDNESLNDPRDFAKPVKAISLL